MKMDASVLGNWHRVGSCFQADGGEQFLATTLTTGRFTVEAPCVIQEDHWDVFYVYYFDVDDIQLTKLPKQLTFEQSICEDRNTEINIAQLANLPLMQNEIQYHWQDGRVDSIHTITTAGTYVINAITDCTTIPITLKVSDWVCDPKIFIPNVFSPNGDGVNDALETFVAVDQAILEYRFSVFNRWGTTVFSSNDFNTTWDGTFAGQDLESGVYVWLLEFAIDDLQNGRVHFQETGDVLILR